MTDAPIRAALRAAEKAVADVFCGEADEDDRLVVVAAVTAFLRALPGPGYVGTPPRTAWITPLHMQNLVDEVARAAEGEG